MVRSLVASMLMSVAVASSTHADNVWVDFSGGGGTPLTVSLPLAVTYTVTNDTPNGVVAFVFRDVGNVTNGSVFPVGGSLAYTVNGGAATAVASLGTFALGVADANDLSLFKTGSAGVGLNDQVVFSSGSVSTGVNIAATPTSGLYSAIIIDMFGVELGVGVAAARPDGDYNFNGTVDAADYNVWRDTLGAMGAGLAADGSGNGEVDAADYDFWKMNFGGAGSGALAAVPVPEPAGMVLMAMGAVFGWARTPRRFLGQGKTRRVRM